MTTTRIRRAAAMGGTLVAFAIGTGAFIPPVSASVHQAEAPAATKNPEPVASEPTVDQPIDCSVTTSDPRVEAEPAAPSAPDEARQQAQKKRAEAAPVATEPQSEATTTEPLATTQQDAAAAEATPAAASDCAAPLEPKSTEKVQVKAFNECYIKRDNGTVTSYYGYDLASEDVSLPAGSAYNFFANTSSNDMGQTSSFQTGLHHLVFSVTWDGAGAAPVWTLNGNSVGATDAGKVCREEPAVPEFPFAVVGPLAVVAAFGGWFILRRRREDAVESIV